MKDDLAGIQRLRLFAARHGERVAVLLVVAGVVSLSVAGVAMAAPTEEATVERDPRTLTTTHAVNATVTERVAPYRAGQELRNEPRYILAAAPNVTVASTTDLPDDGSAEARLVLSYVVVAGDTRLWATNQTLETTSGSGSLRLSHTLNASAVRQRAARLAQNFGAGTTVHVAVETVVDYEAGSYSGEYRTESAVDFPNSRSYAIAPVERSVTRTESVTVTRVDGDRTLGTTGFSPARAGIGALGLALLGGAAWFVRGGRQFDVATERRRLHAARYSVYITSVEGPLDYGWPDEFVASLSALADYAIDTNNQILECQQTGVFLVRDDGRTLVHDPRVDGWDVAAMTPPAPDAASTGVVPDGNSSNGGVGGSDTSESTAVEAAEGAEPFGFDPDVGPGDDESN
ncbi:MAG: DUF5305 family protein [Haloferacaceae archaeon]